MHECNEIRCEKQYMQEGLDRSRSCRDAIERKTINLDGSRVCRESIEQTESSEILLDGSKSYRGSVEITKRRLDKKDICRGYVEVL